MWNIKVNKWLAIALVALFFLICTNPSRERFRNFLGRVDHFGTRRTANLLVCSVYTDGGDTYLGFLLNFVKIHNRKRSNGYFFVMPDTVHRSTDTAVTSSHEKAH